MMVFTLLDGNMALAGEVFTATRSADTELTANSIKSNIFFVVETKAVFNI